MAQQYDDEGSTVLDNDTGEDVSHELTPIAPSGVVAAEISQQVATARAFPRRRDREISNEILGRAILNESIASECVYSIKRGNKTIPGPSIRLAEIIASSFGNVRVAARFVRIDTDDPQDCAVVVQAVAYDCENNYSTTSDIRRSIMTSSAEGRRPRKYNADMTNMTVNAAQSIARRNAILALVPKALWTHAYQRAVAVVKGDQTTLAKRRAELLKDFAALGVTSDQVFATIDVQDISEIQVDHMPALVGMLNAINDGESASSVLGRFGPAETQTHEKVDNPLKDMPIRGASNVIANSRDKREPNRSGAPVSADQGGRGMDDPGIRSTADNGDGDTADRAHAAREEPARKGTPLPENRLDNSGSGRPAEAAGERSGPAASRSAQSGERTPAASGKGKAANGPPPFDSEETYIAFMRWHIKNTRVRTSLKDAWASTRVDRRELLSVNANDGITAEFNAAMAELD